MNYSYKILMIAPTGLRVGGDDQSTKLSEFLEKQSNELGKKGWEMVTAVPTLSHGGAVSKIMAIYKRSDSGKSQ